jgi:hypothetical protein
MVQNREIALNCSINAGGFSGERIAEITQLDGKARKVLAPRHYCWTREGRPLSPDEPHLGTPIDGLVAARRIEDRMSGVLITTPDGDVFLVSQDTIMTRPSVSEITPNVPV